MMGMTINGKHSYDDFHAILASFSKPLPEKQSYTATIPYSNYEPDFSELYGQAVYNLREIEYRFKFALGSAETMQSEYDTFVNWLYSLSGELNIYDDYDETHHFVGKLKTVEEVDTVGKELGAKMLSVIFRCNPYRQPNEQGGTAVI